MKLLYARRMLGISDVIDRKRERTNEDRRAYRYTIHSSIDVDEEQYFYLIEKIFKFTVNKIINRMKSK